MPVDYSSPILDVTLADSSGKTIDLRAWFRQYDVGATLDNKTEGGSLPFANSVEIAMNRGGGAAISVSMSPPYEAWQKFVDAHINLLLPQAVLSVSLGYGRRKTRVYRGLLTGPPSVDFSEDFVSVDLQASASVWYAARSDTKLSESIKSVLSVVGAEGFAPDDLKVSTIDLLRELAKGCGVRLYRLTREGKEVALGRNIPDSLSSLEDEIQSIPHGSDYQRMTALIDRYARLQYYAHGDRVVIYNPGDMMKRDETPVFKWRGKVRPDEGYYPIVGFSNKDIQLAILRSSQKITSDDVDTSNRERKKLDVGEGDGETNLTAGRKKSTRDEPPGTLIGENGQPSPTDSPKKGRATHSSAEDPKGKQKARAEKQSGEEGTGVQAGFETIGHPFLVPGLVVRLRGVTRLYNGKYQILSATHSGDDSGYTTSIDAVCVGLANDGESPYLSDFEGETSVDEGEPEQPNKGDRKLIEARKTDTGVA